MNELNQRPVLVDHWTAEFPKHFIMIQELQFLANLSTNSEKKQAETVDFFYISVKVL